MTCLGFILGMLLGWAVATMAVIVVAVSTSGLEAPAPDWIYLYPLSFFTTALVGAAVGWVRA